MFNNEMLDAFKNNDDIAWFEVYNEYKPMLSHFISRYVSNTRDAAELTNDVFIRNFNKCNEVKTFELLKARFIVTARNLIIDYHRAQAAASRISTEELNSRLEQIGDERSVLYYMIEAEELNRIVKELDKLPKQKRTICIYLMQGYTVKEIADEMNLSINTVYAHLNESRKLLKEEIGDVLAKYKLILYIGFLLSSFIN